MPRRGAATSAYGRRTRACAGASTPAYGWPSPAPSLAISTRPCAATGTRSPVKFTSTHPALRPGGALVGERARRPLEEAAAAGVERGRGAAEREQPAVEVGGSSPG